MHRDPPQVIDPLTPDEGCREYVRCVCWVIALRFNLTSPPAFAALQAQYLHSLVLIYERILAERRRRHYNFSLAFSLCALALAGGACSFDQFRNQTVWYAVCLLVASSGAILAYHRIARFGLAVPDAAAEACRVVALLDGPVARAEASTARWKARRAAGISGT